ncbi:iron ABC transporter permease [Limnohabitans sp. B9-3]|uniref:ABC transporter permease n=1 Tax=Limnohabitans sp. B9-3 TaxID=1100707 RepID=UPI000C1E2A94|nr:iron ABC transporter permease [Limnohabitans sp. B9-3]PIT72917.1 iron ABC transporter permease [Limnohabitans sp. B9-3]
MAFDTQGFFRRTGRGAALLLLPLLALLLALPVLTVLASWLQWNPASAQILLEMAQTVLPDYASTTLLLCVLVSVGVISMGTVSAAAVTLFDFPMRRSLEWALLLPLAMPAYVVAYAYTDFLQFSGPLQTGIRATFGLEGRVVPEVRNVWGAACVFTLALYPYVYLLARTALSERANHLMEAARLLGAPLTRRIVRVALPLARPAIAAGTALALMETLADFGVSSYFGIQTFTAGIYKAWLVMDNRIASAQLATLLLIVVVVLLAAEQRAQSRLRFSSARSDRQSSESQPLRLKGFSAFIAWVLCVMPVLCGFVLPIVFMLRALWLGTDDVALPWARFAQWSITSLSLGLFTALLAVGAALLLAAQARLQPNWLTRQARWVVSLGYAVPGAVIVVGLLLPTGWVQATWPNSGVGFWLTATVLGLVWAYLVRFVAVALQSVQSGYARVPASLDDSARMLGVSGLALVRRVHWPLLKKPVAAATLLVLVDVMKELPATLVLRPFNTDTLAVMAYQLARDERLGEAALPSLALVLVGLLPVILLSRTLRRS